MELFVEDYNKFESWLNKLLKNEFSKSINAFNFNLYEGSENTYDIQLIGSDEFEENEDWACSEVYSSKEDICYINRSENIEDWRDGFEYVKLMVTKYLESGIYKNKLLLVDAVGLGFVDGDIELIYKK